MKKKLTPKQKRFVKEYMIDLNATQAAIRAGYSQKTSHSQGPRLLENVEVQALIEKKQGKLSKRFEITQERVIKEWAAIAFANPKAYFKRDKKGNVTLRDFDEMTDEQLAAISGVMQYGGKGEGRMLLKFWNKPKSLEMIARHLGMFEDKLFIEQKVEIKVDFFARLEKLIEHYDNSPTAQLDTGAEGTAASVSSGKSVHSKPHSPNNKTGAVSNAG